MGRPTMTSLLLLVGDLLRVADVPRMLAQLAAHAIDCNADKFPIRCGAVKWGKVKLCTNNHGGDPIANRLNSLNSQRICLILLL